ncbi:MAG: lytic transglycosylase [Flavobacteriales bacterium]|nr:MAG: lytic transglycosylase [Flavobacteriales bacterium]
MRKIINYLLICMPAMLFSQNGGSIINFSTTSIANYSHDSLIKNNYSETFTTEILKERLKQLNNDTPFIVEHNATVERIIRLYLKTRKENLGVLLDKAQYFFPMIEEQLDKHNLPLELKYLALVESALEPTAKSNMGATGIWQFMYHTGKEYGLQINSYIDERADPLKATEAACNFLNDLYQRFGDWDLAMAAYNSGPGNVTKAIRRAGGLRNYWNIRQFLPQETSGYVPQFYAILYLLEYANEHGIFPNNEQLAYAETDTIHINKKIDFKLLATKLNTPVDFIKKLNPQYKRNVIPASRDKKYVLSLPKSQIADFIAIIERENLSLTPNREPNKRIEINPANSYTLKNNDNLNRVAKKFNITLSNLKKWNGLQTDYVIAGQTLVVDKDAKSKLTEKNISIPEPKNVIQYTVREGDSLFIISRRFENISVNQLRKWNNLEGKNYLMPGTTVKILTSTK